MTKQEKLKQVIVECINECINQQLLPYDLTYDDVKKGGKKEFIKVFRPKLNTLWGFIKYPTFYEKVPWYQYYTFKTKEQFEDWKTFCILKIMKCGYTKEHAEREFAWFNLGYGLKQEYLYAKV